MASKVCPVCKTFSSSSNTTLNAHIDQCLSAESSAPKWTVDSKLSTRHRIKPRKTRLMVDIYATALPCTLEDLDRRNGSNWALGASNFPTPDPERSDKSVEEKEQHVDNDHASCEDVGAVYIDSNGIKLRILSKSDDAPPQLSRVIEHLRPRKPFKAGKGSKFLSARKKKRRASKLSHYLKLAQTKKLLTSKARSSQICGGGGIRHVAEGSHEGDVQKQVNPGNSGNLRPWARSKRSGVVKKRNWNGSSDVESHLSRFNGSHLGQNQLLGGEQSVAGSSLSVASITGNDERSLTPMKRNARQLRKSAMPVPPLIESIKLRGSKTTKVSDDVSNKSSEIVPSWDSLEHDFTATGQLSVHGHGIDNIDSSVLDKVDDDGGSVHRDYQCPIDDAINVVSRFSAKVAVDETLSTSHKPVNSEMDKMGPLCDVQVLASSFVGGQDMFYGVQLGNDDMLVQNVNMGDDLNSEIVHGSSSFPDVDPIPIPGPPGSFLPSPRDMSSEDFQGNSSLTTSRVQSSQDQPDGDSSDSPVSATSTISNSTASRYDLEALPSAAVSLASRDKMIRLSFSGGSVDSSVDMATRSTSCMGAEGLGFDKERYKVNKTHLGFKTDTQPCCCQKKERASHDDHQPILNSQESQLLKRRVMNLPDLERQTLGTAVDTSSDHHRMHSPMPNSARQNVWRGPTPGRSDCDSMSPSSSNSILRLMGKNLMVVNNRDQDGLMQAVPQSQINHPSSSQFPMFTASGVIQQQQQQQQQLYRTFHQGSVILGHNSPRTSQVFYQGQAQGQGPGYSFSSQPVELRADYNVHRNTNSIKEDLSRDVAKYAGPFYACHQSDHGLPEPPLTLPSRQANNASSPVSVGWPSSVGGSGLLQQGQYMATPSSSTSSRSALYKCSQSSLL